MSYQINTATLAGRLVRDPKITTLTGSEKTTLIARARIAIDRSENKTDFIDIFAMGGRAEYIKKLKKGSPLALTGYIRNANYTTNEGEKKYGNEVVALTVSSEQGGALTANNLYVFGRLTDDPKVHDTANGKFVTFTLAVKMPYEETKRRKKDEGDADADFFRVIVNGKYAEFTEKYLQKGDPVGIPGSIKTDSYTRTEDNQKVYTFDIDAERVSFAISKTEKDARKAAKEQKQAPAQPYSQQQYGQQNGWGGQYGQAQQPAYGQQQPQQYGQQQPQQYGQQPQQAPAQYGQQNGWGGQYGQAQQPAYGQQQYQQYATASTGSCPVWPAERMGRTVRSGPAAGVRSAAAPVRTTASTGSCPVWPAERMGRTVRSDPAAGVRSAAVPAVPAGPAGRCTASVPAGPAGRCTASVPAGPAGRCTASVPAGPAGRRTDNCSGRGAAV